MNLNLSEKIGNLGFQVKQNLSLFCNLVALILSWNCVKSLIVAKIVQKVNFEGDWANLEAKTCCQKLLQNFLLFFMFSLSAPTIKNSHTLAGIYFILLENVLGQT